MSEMKIQVWLPTWPAKNDISCKGLQGYTGSYETLKRKVGKLKKHKQKIAYMRFETDPGH